VNEDFDDTYRPLEEAVDRLLQGYQADDIDEARKALTEPLPAYASAVAHCRRPWLEPRRDDAWFDDGGVINAQDALCFGFLQVSACSFVRKGDHRATARACHRGQSRRATANPQPARPCKKSARICASSGLRQNNGRRHSRSRRRFIHRPISTPQSLDQCTRTGMLGMVGPSRPPSRSAS